MSIVTITLNPSVDRTFSVDRVIPERKLMADGLHRYPGGGGLNVARAAMRLGQTATALWSCGGTTGELLCELLEGEQIKHHPVTIKASVRENIIVYDRSCNNQYRFGMPGPDLRPGEWDSWREKLREHTGGASYVVFSGSLPESVPAQQYREFIENVPRGVRVIVDTKGKALRAALSTGVFLVKPNLHELEQVVGRELGDDQRVEQAARELVRSGQVEAALISLGRGGALLVTKKSTQHIAAPAVPLRSKVGAGDSMVAGLVTALERHLPLAEAARFAVAAGAAAVMTEGTELCRREDTERLFPEIRYEEVNT